MSIWFEIVLTVSLPIFFILLLVLANRLKQNVVVNNGIFKQNQKIYKHIMLSGLVDLMKDLFASGMKLRSRKKELKENEQTD